MKGMSEVESQWGSLWAVSWAFLLSGATGQVLALGSAQWNRPEWELAYFGEFSATLGPVVVGLVGLAALGVARGHRVGPRLVGAVFLGLAFWCVVGSVLVLLDLPLVWAAVRRGSDWQEGAGMKIVAMKGFALSGAYAVGLFFLSMMTFRSVAVRRVREVASSSFSPSKT